MEEYKRYQKEENTENPSGFLANINRKMLDTSSLLGKNTFFSDELFLSHFSRLF